MLWMYQRVFFGPLREPHALASQVSPPGEGQGEGACATFRLREVCCLAPLAGVHRLDRPAAAVLPRPHGAHAGRADRAGDASGRMSEAREERTATIARAVESAISIAPIVPHP